MGFDQLFRPVLPEEIFDRSDVFTMVGKEFFAVTSGTCDHYNALVGSGGGFGMLFRKPSSWCVLRADRYTLGLMMKAQTYTLSYFPEECREDLMFLGSKSGNNSEKMKESRLRGIQTPARNTAFEEARLIIECRLTEITTPASDDFYEPGAKEYFDKAYAEEHVYRKYVFGEITQAWTKR